MTGRSGGTGRPGQGAALAVALLLAAAGDPVENATGPFITQASGLSADSLARAVERIRDYRAQPHRHVVHPREYERGGLVRCADCFQVIEIPPGGSTSGSLDVPAPDGDAGEGPPDVDPVGVDLPEPRGEVG